MLQHRTIWMRPMPRWAISSVPNDRRKRRQNQQEHLNGRCPRPFPWFIEWGRIVTLTVRRNQSVKGHRLLCLLFGIVLDGGSRSLGSRASQGSLALGAGLRLSPAGVDARALAGWLAWLAGAIVDPRNNDVTRPASQPASQARAHHAQTTPTTHHTRNTPQRQRHKP